MKLVHVAVHQFSYSGRVWFVFRLSLVWILAQLSSDSVLVLGLFRLTQFGSDSDQFGSDPVQSSSIGSVRCPGQTWSNLVN
ncbi:hypothetical protein Hdeb2414_s0015g00448261 [Helianthus debilis subsp. tardiflorus]